MIDVDALLQPLSDDSPCGEDLSYDPAFLELETLMQGKPERQVGDQIIQAEEPNWRDVRTQALELAGRTRDMRVALILSVSLIRTEGIEGFRVGMSLMRGLMEKYWDKVHPQLDPDDGFDPMERINVLASLSPPPGSDISQDPMKIRPRLLEAPLSMSKVAGSFSQRDVLIAKGELNVEIDPERPPADLALIGASFEDTEIESLQGVDAALAEVVDHVKMIDTVLTNKVGPSRAPDLSGIGKTIDEISATVKTYLAERGVGEAPIGDAGPEGGEATGPAGPGGAALSGDIRNTQDVLIAIDKICQYYERVEPSSPVPAMLRRARKLVNLDFMAIIQDVAPQAMSQVQTIFGSDD